MTENIRKAIREKVDEFPSSIKNEIYNHLIDLAEYHLKMGSDEKDIINKINTY